MYSFISAFKNSFYSPKFYHELPHKPASFTIFYFYACVTVVALLLTFMFGAQNYSAIETVFTKELPSVVHYFPHELSITIKDGMLATNVEEPYGIQMTDKSERYRHLVVIDTGREYTPESFTALHTMVLLTGKYAMYEEKGRKISIVYFKDLPNFTIDRALLDTYVAKFMPILSVVAPILIVLMFFAIFFFLQLFWAYFLFGGLLVWLVAKLKKLPYSYGACYRMSVHLATPGAILLFFSSFAPIPYAMFLFFALLILSAVVNLEKA